MTEGLVSAYLVHALPGRIRLRIPHKRGDAAYFAGLAQVLSRERIGDASVNAVTGSVLLRVPVRLKPDELALSARELALFDLRDPPPLRGRSPLVTAAAGLHGIDGLLLRATGGVLDVRSGVFIALLLLAGRQIYKGQFMVPGFTLLWYALNLMME